MTAEPAETLGFSGDRAHFSQRGIPAVSALSQHLTVRTLPDGSAMVHFSDEKGVRVKSLGRADRGSGYSIEIDAWGEGSPRLAAVVTVQAKTESIAIRKATGAALLFYEEDEAWPPAALAAAS